MLYNIKFFILFLIVGLTFFSCSKEDYEAQVPTYITINEINLTTDYATQGTNSENIVDAWVFMNDDLVGVYELPATFPVLKEGDVILKVYAGIKNNGITAARARYLLYDPHEEKISLVKGETIEVNPTISYASGVKFSWLEDFENASLFFLYTADSDTIINKQSVDVKEGSYSGQVFLQPDMDFFEATTLGLSGVPRNGTPVYLELDFKTNEPLSIGIYVDTDQYSYITLNATSEWKKIYINLTDVINNTPRGAEMKVFLGIKEVSIPFLTDHPEIFLDNLKLVHF